ncbi:hypothetical protein RCZ04_05000 [Capnocytophaga sp. HP1101]
MVIEKFTDTLENPLLPKAFQSLKRRDLFAIDYTHQQIGVCNETKGFSLYTFEKELLWQVDKPICGALLAVERQQIWLAERNDAEHITVWVHDLQGNAIASLPMEDEIYEAGIEMKLLPNNGIAIAFHGGQDGCVSYLLSFEKGKLSVAKELPDDVDFCCMLNEKEAVLTDFYSSKLYVVAYPSLQTLKEHQFPKEWSVMLTPFEGAKFLVTNISCDRHYLFNISTMTIEEEIVFKGFEPYIYEPYSDTDKVTDIDSLHYHNGQWIGEYTEVDNIVTLYTIGLSLTTK